MKTTRIADQSLLKEVLLQVQERVSEPDQVTLTARYQFLRPENRPLLRQLITHFRRQGWRVTWHPCCQYEGEDHKYHSAYLTLPLPRPIVRLAG